MCLLYPETHERPSLDCRPRASPGIRTTLRRVRHHRARGRQRSSPLKIFCRHESDCPLLRCTVRFVTQVYHPNVTPQTGLICLSTLNLRPKGDWTPATNLSTRAPGRHSSVFSCCFRDLLVLPSRQKKNFFVFAFAVMTTIRVLLSAPNPDDGLVTEIVSVQNRFPRPQCAWHPLLCCSSSRES